MPRHRRICAALAIALLGQLAACGGGQTGPTATSVPSLPTTGTGCGGHTLASGTYTTRIGGVTRTVIVHVPPSLRRSPSALVLNLHGSGSTAAQQEKFSGMNATADAHSFIVVYPQALIPDKTGYDWNVPGEPLVTGSTPSPGTANDVAFLSQLVPMLEHSLCIDPHRVYVTGFSGGGRMASQLGCDSTAIFAAVGAVAGLRYPGPCGAGRGMPVIAFHGTADPIDPFEGGGPPYWGISVPSAANQWAQLEHCGPATASTPVATVTLTTYSGCLTGSEIQLYAIRGMGHEWPGGVRVGPRVAAVLGPQSSVVDADSLMWSFFASHPMPS